MINGSQWIYAKRPKGDLTPDCYEHHDVSIAEEVADDEVLVEGEFWSVDPYMRIQQSAKHTWEAPHPLNAVQGSAVVGRVLRAGAHAEGLADGDWVETYMGWQTHGVRKADACRRLDPAIAPPSTALHILGMPGRTAFFGLREAGRPVAGETLLVSGAAGAVGSIVGQLGRLAGLHVVGVVGSQAKADWITGELGFHSAINYKENDSLEPMSRALAQQCPQGIDVYFDNTGGYITDAMILNMNLRARIVVCGQISQYQGGLDDPASGPRLLHHFLYKRAFLQGILARDYTNRMDEMLTAMQPLLRDGKIKYRETKIKGFDQLPNALCGLFVGENTGKMMVEK